MPDENGLMDPLEAADHAMLEYAPDKYHLVNGRVWRKPQEADAQHDAAKESG